MKRAKYSDSLQLGKEPAKVLPTHESLGKALNWYSYNFDRPTGRKWVAEFMTAIGMKEDVQAFMACTDWKVTSTLCAVAKIMLNGNSLPDGVLDRFMAELETLIEIGDDFIRERQRRLSIRFRDKNKKIADDYIADIEDALDEFYNNSYKITKFDVKIWLKDKNPRKEHVSIMLEYYIPLIKELTQYKEDYKHLTPSQYKNYLIFISSIINGLVAYLKNEPVIIQPVAMPAPTPVNKPVRKKKQKPIDVLIKDVKFKRENKDIPLSSIDVRAVIGAKSLVLYNDKYKVMTFLTAKTDDGFSIKGTTVINVNDGASYAKVIKNPKSIQLMVSGAIKIFKKSFDGLPTKSKAGSGRLNSDTLIIKAYK